MQSPACPPAASPGSPLPSARSGEHEGIAPLPPARWDRVSHGKDPGTENIHRALAEPRGLPWGIHPGGFLEPSGLVPPRSPGRTGARSSAFLPGRNIFTRQFLSIGKAGSSAYESTSAVAGEEGPRWVVGSPQPLFSSLPSTSLCPITSPVSRHFSFYLYF